MGVGSRGNRSWQTMSVRRSKIVSTQILFNKLFLPDSQYIRRGRSFLGLTPETLWDLTVCNIKTWCNRFRVRLHDSHDVSHDDRYVVFRPTFFGFLSRKVLFNNIFFETLGRPKNGTKGPSRFDLNCDISHVRNLSLSRWMMDASTPFPNVDKLRVK